MKMHDTHLHKFTIGKIVSTCFTKLKTNHMGKSALLIQQVVNAIEVRGVGFKFQERSKHILYS